MGVRKPLQNGATVNTLEPKTRFVKQGEREMRVWFETLATNLKIVQLVRGRMLARLTHSPQESESLQSRWVEIRRLLKEYGSCPSNVEMTFEAWP
jgi:hypothetical protein